MRLSQQQCNVIRTAAQRAFGEQVKVWLFGSRVNDTLRGGDIDLLIETEQTNISEISRAEIGFQVELQTVLGEQKIDVLLDYPNRQSRPPIFSIARAQGVRL